MIETTPKVLLIGESRITDGFQDALAALGVPEWETDAFSDTEKLTEFAGKICYKSFSLDLNKNLTRIGTRNNLDYIQQGLIAPQHGSTLEHTYVNFALLDVSRVLTHELVRHGEGTAFSQESGRYVRLDGVAMFIPSIIRENPALLAEFYTTVEIIENQYKKLIAISGINESTDFGWKKLMTSALRRVLPEGRANAIMFSANHRALRHVIEMRTSTHAEEEIRIVFIELFKALVNRYPAIYADAQMVYPKGDPIPEVIFKYHKV